MFLVLDFNLVLLCILANVLVLNIFAPNFIIFIDFSDLFKIRIKNYVDIVSINLNNINTYNINIILYSYFKQIREVNENDEIRRKDVKY
jgi:predicted nuclease of predicted toxin-antitoxin system